MVEKNGSLIKFIGSILGLLAVMLAVLQINIRLNNAESKLDTHNDKPAHATAIEHFKILDRMIWDHEERLRGLERR